MTSNTKNSIYFRHGLLLLWSLALSGVSICQEVPGNMMYQPFIGVKKVLFLRVVYPDFPQHGYSDQEMNKHAEDLAQIFLVNSYGQVTLDIEVTPVLMMPQPSFFYALENRLSYVRIRSDAIKVAADAGYQASDYDREAIYTKKLWPQEPFGVGSINSRTYYSRKVNSPAHSAHELGHTLDWRHAEFFKVDASANPLDSSGEVIRYGDKFDIMGDAFNFHHFNPWYKNRVGWLPYENILSVENSGIYTLRAVEDSPFGGSSTNSFWALKIPWTPDQEFWIYYRKNESFVNNGALISQVSPRNSSICLLLDMTPGSREADHRDAALAVGETMKDPETGLEIKVVEKFADSLHVQIQVPVVELDVLPIIDILSPPPGVTVTGSVQYEATAYDPDIGLENGAGIDSVVFVLGYGMGDNFWDTGLTFVPVARQAVTAPPYVFVQNTTVLSDEVYSITVGAASSNGGINTAILRHIIDNTGPSVVSRTDDHTHVYRSWFALDQNIPNPFYESTAINYSLQKEAKVKLIIYDLHGQVTRTLVHAKHSPGSYTVFWNGSDDLGREKRPGIYFYEMRVGKFAHTKKILLLD